MKIGFDAKRAFNNSSGLGNYARWLIRSVATEYPQHEYYLFTPAVRNQYRSYFSDLANVHVVSPVTLLGKFFHSLWRSYAIARLCNRLNLDVYHGLSNELPAGIHHFLGKKIVTLHDVIFMRYPRYYPITDRFFYRNKTSYALQEADSVIAISRATQNDITRYFGTDENKITVLGMDCHSSFRTAPSDDNLTQVLRKYNVQTPYILNVGTPEPRKNQQLLVQVLSSLNNKSVKLVLVGKHTAYADELMKLAQELQLSDRVLMLHGVPTSDLPAIYRMASAFVYPSGYEGFGIPLLEAMCSGVPVVTSAVSSLPEVAGPAALLIEPNNAAALKQAIDSVLDDESLRLKLIQEGQKQAQLFATEVLMPQLMKLYTS